MITTARLEARGGDEVGRAVEGREGGESLGVRAEDAVLGRVRGVGRDRPLQQGLQRSRRRRFTAAPSGCGLVAHGDRDLVEGYSAA